MLAYFMHFAVPGVRDVVIFRDHADAQQFYILNDRPRIATDSRTGLPLFSFTLFSRNIEIAYASAAPGTPVENQLGALNMTVDLSVSDADMATIRQYLVNLLKEEQQRPSAFNRLYEVRPRAGEPRIGYVDWLSGSVRLDMLEGLGNTFKRASSPATTPTLHGTNKAALWATFGSEGAQLIWGSLHPQADGTGAAGGGTAAAPIEANITYTLEGLARSPGLDVTVTAHSEAIYKELRERTTVHERNGNQSWTYPQVAELTKAMQESRTIDIVWNDYGIPSADPAADTIKQQLESTVMGVITNQIVTLFFTPFQFKGLTDEDLGKTFTHTTNGKPGSRLWLREFKESFSQDLTFTMKKTQNVRFPAAPQTSLLPELTPEQRDQLVRVVDVGSPEIRVMTVQLFTNADFKADRIANITATLSYRQFDTLVNDWIETSDSFVFRTGEEVFQFRTRLARDNEGRLIDLYDAKAQINYIGVSQSPPAIELKGIAERALTFSYDRLGYVKVEVQAGDIDWTEIRDVFVDLVYDAARTEPDAQGTVHLTASELKGQWSTSKHGRSSNTYQYVVRYLFKDGREQSATSRSDSRGTLVVHDAIVSRLRRTFDVAMDAATVASVLLKVRYPDPPRPTEEARHVFTDTGSWEYVRPLSQGGPEAIDYSYDIQYKDGQVDRVGWKSLTRDDESPAITARRFRFSLMVDGGGLDWTRWRVAVIDLTYRDDDHQYLHQDTLRLTRDGNFLQSEVLAFAPDAREYEFHAVIAPLGDGEPVEVPPDGGTRKAKGVLLLERLV